MASRKKATTLDPEDELLFRELRNEWYNRGYEQAMRQCQFKLGLGKLGNAHGMVGFYRALCAGYDLAAVKRQFELIIKLNSWQEVFAAMDSVDEDGTAEPTSYPSPAETNVA